jgi:quinol monooxygenase YgiN
MANGADRQTIRARLTPAQSDGRQWQHRRIRIMVTVGLLIRLEARPGKEADVETFLHGVMPLIAAEPGTTALFALRLGPSQFGIFNAFPDEAALEAHVNGRAAEALFGRAEELFASQPAIESVGIVAAKLPPVAVAA